MRDLALPLAVMAVTILVAIGLMTFFRHLLKLRQQLAPEVVNAAPAEKEASTGAPSKTARATPAIRHHDLAA